MHTRQYIFGMDIGGTFTKIGIADDAGKMIAHIQCPTEDIAGDASADAIHTAIRTLLAQADVPASSIAAAGVAVPAVVDAQGHSDVCVNAPAVHADECCNQVRAVFPMAAFTCVNDANAAAWSTWNALRERGYTSVATVTLGTGVGCGIVNDGRLMTGAHGAAGELGHLCIERHDGRPCLCGRTGCLETYVTAGGLTRSYAEYGGRVLSLADAKVVFEAAQSADRAACRAVARFAEDLAFGLAQASCLIDCDVFAIGGGLAAAADLFLPATQTAYTASVFPSAAALLCVAPYRNDSGWMGAALLALESPIQLGAEE